MNTKSGEDDSLPYTIWTDPKGSIHYRNKSSKLSMTREEAFQAAQLEQLVERHSIFVREYYLVRSALSDKRSERQAWQILYLLHRFVEAYGRFPTLRKIKNGKSELSDYLSHQLEMDDVFVNVPLQVQYEMRRSCGLSPKRPIFQRLDNFQLREIGNQLRVSLKRLIHDNIFQDDAVISLKTPNSSKTGDEHV